MAYIQFIPEYINTLLISILILFVGTIIGKICEKITFNIIRELELSAIIRHTTDVRFSLEKVVSLPVKWLIIFISLIQSLQYLGIQSIVANIFLIIVGFITGLSLLLLINDWIPNVLANIWIKHIGQQILVGKLQGRVINTTWTQIIIETKNGDVYHIPKSAIY